MTQFTKPTHERHCEALSLKAEAIQVFGDEEVIVSQTLDAGLLRYARNDGV